MGTCEIRRSNRDLKKLTAKTVDEDTATHSEFIPTPPHPLKKKSLHSVLISSKGNLAFLHVGLVSVGDPRKDYSFSLFPIVETVNSKKQ